VVLSGQVRFASKCMGSGNRIGMGWRCGRRGGRAGQHDLAKMLSGFFLASWDRHVFYDSVTRDESRLADEKEDDVGGAGMPLAPSKPLPAARQSSASPPQ